MNEQMLQRVKIDGDVAILLNYTINDDLNAFFEYAHNLGLNKYAICDVFGTRYVLTANGLKGVPLVEYGLISDHITTETPEEKTVEGENEPVEEVVEQVAVEEQAPEVIEEAKEVVYSKADYDAVVAEKEKAELALAEKAEVLNKYQPAIEYYEKIFDIARVDFEAKIAEMQAAIDKANADRDAAIAKLDAYKERVAALLNA